MSFRFFRSKTFWFGVPGLVGLLWGWWVSMGHHSMAGFLGPRLVVAGQIQGEVYAHSEGSGWLDWSGFICWHEPVPVDHASELKSALARQREQVSTAGFVFVRYYRVVLCYIVVWTGLLIWRQRKFGKRWAE